VLGQCLQINLLGVKARLAQVVVEIIIGALDDADGSSCIGRRIFTVMRFGCSSSNALKTGMPLFIEAPLFD
jgi:hypothetical protein